MNLIFVVLRGLALHRVAILLVVAASVVAISGCAVNRATATIDPTADLSRVKTVHVVKSPEDDHQIDVLISDGLRSRGYTVTVGAEKRPDVDANVIYVDKWWWDITPYMLALTITIRDPADDYPLANGRSLHTSLTRLSPNEMVDEVLTNILKGVKK
jgi:hypothetical protein